MSESEANRTISMLRPRKTRSSRKRATEPTPPTGEIAIVGMACMFPGAPDLETFWRNIITSYDAIDDVPPGRWDVDPFYDPASSDDDRIYSKRGGYLPSEIAFDPLRYGIMPVAVSGGEVDQFLVLKLVYDALADAGYTDGLPDGARTEFVLGRGNYLGPGNSNLFQRSVGIEQTLRILRALHPEHTEEELEAIRRDLRSSLPPFGPDLGATHIPNVVTGRSANRLDFMGRNYTVDAACASSLIALETAMADLLTGKCDLAISGGSHTFTCVPLLMVFSTLNALSRSSRMRPFDAEADGTLPGEGIGIIVLKRRADAERDGDRIYAIVKGVGSASDGRALSVMAPRLEGEVLALRRAYAAAGVDPRTVGLIEGHGTATTVGDETELHALGTVFGEDSGQAPHIAIGTVKSMIGHSMPASGVAGIIKMALSLYHKVLPPTLHCDSPLAPLGRDGSPFYANTETRPWINGRTGTPRRAGVNAFGFGGINAHVVLEENAPQEIAARNVLPWDSELFLLSGATVAEVHAAAVRLQDYLAQRPEIGLTDLAYTMNRRFQPLDCRLSIVAGSREELDKKLARAITLLAKPDCKQIKDPRGIYFLARSLAGPDAPANGKVAFLFPGEGSQRIDMLAQLCLHFPEVRAVFDNADDAILSQGRSDPISADIFPPPAHSKEEREQAELRLWRLDRQCEAIMAANRAMFTLLTAIGLKADMMVGHSIGEWSSLTAGGIAEADPPVEALRSLDHMAKAITDDPTIPTAALLAVAINRAAAEAAIEGLEDVYVALDNCPHQVVLAASDAASEKVVARLREQGIGFERSRFDRGSHTPLFAGFIEVARRHFAGVAIASPQVQVYSCLTGAPLPDDPAEIRRLIVQSWERPVEYRRTIEAMYEAGARIFVEVGPGGVLTAFTDDILRGKNALVQAIDLPKWTNTTGLNNLVGLLAAQGLDLNLGYLFRNRTARELTLNPAQDAPAVPAHNRPLVMLNLAVPMMSLHESTVAAIRENHPVRHITVETEVAATVTEVAPVTAYTARHETPVGAGHVIQDGAHAATGDSAREDVIEGQHLITAQQTASRKPAATALPPVAPPPTPSVTLVPPASPAVARGLPTPTPNSVPPLAATERGSVLEHYAQTMHGFLQAEQRVMRTVMHGAPPLAVRRSAQHAVYAAPVHPVQPSLPSGPDDRSGPLPLLGEVLSHEPGHRLVARRRFDPGEDLYLHDHTFGGPMSVIDPTLEPLVVAPLTVSLELMAEAAAQLVPGKLVVGIGDVRAHRWVQVDEEAPTILDITAWRLDETADAVRVEVQQRGTDGKDAMVIEGSIYFSTSYQPAPPATPLNLTNPRRTAKTATEMYREKWMFHGPVFQGVVSLDASGDDGISGTLEVLPTNTLFRSTTHPYLLTDVALIDAAGQLLGYWAKERLATHFVVFPIRVARLTIYQPNFPAGTRVRCNVRVSEILPQMVKVDMEVLDPHGHVWMRIDGWQDWRFHIIGPVYDFWRFPNATIMSTPCAVPVPAAYAHAGLACYRMDLLVELGHTMVTKCLAYMALNHDERHTYHGLRTPEQRQIEWLAGRIAAKDAVRVYLRQRYGLQVGPGDIEITSDEHGRPIAHGRWQQQIGTAPSISVAHTDGRGIAIAGDVLPGGGLGIDMQRVVTQSDAFDETAFAPEERSILFEVTGPARDERRMRLWCAKEAATKALGRGLVEGPRSVVIARWHDEVGIAEIAMRGLLAAEFPSIASRHLIAYTRRDGEYVIATSFGEVV